MRGVRLLQKQSYGGQASMLYLPQAFWCGWCFMLIRLVRLIRAGGTRVPNTPGTTKWVQLLRLASIYIAPARM